MRFEVLDTTKPATTKEYRVAAVSVNVGAFGHKQATVVARDGEAWNLHFTWAGYRPVPKVGDVLALYSAGGYPQPDARFWFECPERRPDASPVVVKLVWDPQSGEVVIHAEASRGLHA
jgi:hypothetical protein